MTTSPKVLTKLEYNITCSVDISFYISSRQNFPVAYTLMGVTNALFSITAFACNVIILLALRRCNSLHPTSKLLFYILAISDLATGLVGQPLYSVYLFAIAWDNPRLFCAVGLPHTLITSLLGVVSLWTLTVIALDRYLALRLRFRYRSVVKVHRIALILMAGWLFIALVTASRIFSIKLRLIISNLILPICLMLSSYFYVRTYLSLRQHKLQIITQSSFILVYYRKSLNSMFLVFCLFLTSYLPFVCALAAANVSVLRVSLKSRAVSRQNSGPLVTATNLFISAGNFTTALSFFTLKSELSVFTLLRFYYILYG